MASQNPEHSRQPRRDTFRSDSLHLFVLCGFAVAQPLFDLLSRQAEFFIFQNVPRTDIIALVVLLSLLLPLGLVGLEGLIGLVSRRLRRWVHYALLACGVALIVLPALHSINAVRGIFLVYGALVLGVYAALLYAFFAPVRLFFSLLSPAALIFPTLFLFASPVFRIVFPADASLPLERVQIPNPPPIIFIIFDEFPTISLLNEHHQIDAERYPNFAALAGDATWFRNATTVSDSTYYAVPAILTGNYPEPDRLPHAIDYPHNLFTLLAGTYDLHASGTLTQLCPDSLCPQVQRPMQQRLSSLLSDLTVVYLHLLLPPDLRDRLPSIAHKWNNHVLRLVDQDFPDRRRHLSNFVRAIQATDRPSLYFLHVLLPHNAYDYLPSGKSYNRQSGLAGISGARVTDWRYAPDPWNVLQLHHRHLLQVGFVDTWLGELMDHLRTIGLYDQALLVLTADHGISFRPGDFVRRPTQTTFQDILPVPLFIKAPFHTQGHIDDRPTETTDILPTLAEMLGIALPWPVDGHSALGPPPTQRDVRIYPSSDRQPTVFTGLAEARRRAVARQHRLFGSGPFFSGLYRQSPFPALIGLPLNAAGGLGAAPVQITLDWPDAFTDIDLEADFIPAHITGHVTPSRLGGRPVSLAVAINGTIRATTRPWSVPISGRDGSWSAVVPETAFRAGPNTVEVFVVSEVAGQATR